MTKVQTSFFGKICTLYSHKKSFHLKQRKYVCDWSECKKTFPNKRRLDEHKRTHTREKPFPCNIDDCLKTFGLKRGLKLHQDSIHFNKRYSCDWKDCNKTFSQLIYLNRHKKYIHKNQNKFQCDVEGCGKVFMSKQGLIYHKRIHLGEIYITPNQMNDIIVNQFNEIYNKFATNECLIIGDLNVNLNSTNENIWTSNMIDIGFQQMITENTRNNALLDHCYTNRPNNISAAGVLKIPFSDHFPIFTVRKHRIGDRLQPKTKRLIFYRQWKDLNIQKITEKISEIDLKNNTDVNKTTNDFNYKINEIMKNDIKLKKKFIKIEIKDNWISSEVMLSIKERDISKLKLMYGIRHGLPKHIYDNLKANYKRLRNKTRKEINKCKKTFINNKIAECHDSKEMWKLLKTVLPNNRNLSEDIPLDAKTLNDSFIDDRDALLHETCAEEEDIPLDFAFKTDKVFEIPEITKENVENIISKMSENKATGSDGVSARFIKRFITPLLPLLLIIFNQSIKTKVFPISWKISRVTALHKKGSKKDPQNYRPISVVPFISKILEKHVFDHFYNFLNENKLLSENQFGFKRKHSVIDALLALKRNTITSLNNNQKCIIVSLDLKKAFDVISHQLLVDKLLKYGCSESSLKWFKSYLEDRHQFVRTQKSVSNIRRVGNTSVPQGSIGSPILFITFINDIMELPLRGKVILFADDTTLTETGANYTQLVENTNYDLELINNWLTKNRLILNKNKSNYMLMGRPRADTTLDIKIGSQPLERVFESKILGVLFNPSLSFETHLSNTCKTISKRISFLSRIRHFFPQKTVHHIFNAIILPHFDYADTLWGHTYAKHLQRISRLQIRAAKTIINETNHSSIDALKRLEWLPLKNRIGYHSVIYIFKSMNNLASNMSSNFFQYSKTRTSNRLGDDLKLNLINPKNNFFINSLFYNGIKIYNDLSFEIRSSQTLNSFKTHVFNHFKTF